MSVKSLSIMSVKYPKIKFDNKQRVFVVFYHNNKRYRLSNGSKVNIDIYPNSYPISKREEIANLLAAEVFKYISSGLVSDSDGGFNWRWVWLNENGEEVCVTVTCSDCSYLIFSGIDGCSQPT